MIPWYEDSVKQDDMNKPFIAVGNIFFESISFQTNAEREREQSWIPPPNTQKQKPHHTLP